MSFKPTRAFQQSLQDLQAGFVILLSLIFSAFLLSHLIPIDEPVSETMQALFLFPEALRPETQERRLFMALLVLLLPLNFFILKRFFLLQCVVLTTPVVQKISFSTLPLLLIFAVDWDETLLGLLIGGVESYLSSACLMFLLAITVVYPLFYGNFFTKWLKKSQSRLMAVATMMALAAIAMSVLSYRVQSIALVNEAEKWTVSFEAVFYSVSQVAAGKTVLADLPAQYGLYAELLKPIFMLTGLSVLNFTGVMGVLQITGLLSLMWFCWQHLHNSVLRLFTLLSLCLLIGGTWAQRMFVIGLLVPPDEYYQYWSLRFVFPAVSLYLFAHFLKSQQSYRAVALMASYSGLAILWNLDSGIPVCGAFLAYLLLQFSFPLHTQRWAEFKKLLLANGVILLLIYSFGHYLQSKAGMPIDWQQSFKYQQLFYQAGFFMLPLPMTPHPWMVVIAIYLFVITGAMARRLRQQPAPFWDKLFFIAILGLGLFAYYQGRSHILLLTAVAWPALLIGFLLTDRTVRAMDAKLLPAWMTLTLLPMLLIGLILSAAFVDGLPILANVAQHHWHTMAHSPQTRVVKNIAFIRQHSTGATRAVIIAPHQAVYFAETGLASAINGAGWIETILVADRQLFFAALRHQPVAHLFIQQQNLTHVWQNLAGHYQITARSSEGLLYLTPATSMQRH